MLEQRWLSERRKARYRRHLPTAAPIDPLPGGLPIKDTGAVSGYDPLEGWHVVEVPGMNTDKSPPEPPKVPKTPLTDVFAAD